MGAPPAGYGAAGMRQLNEMFPTAYDPAYIQNAVMAFVRTNLYAAQRPFLPMIDETLSKENALPYDLWGMLYDDWGPNLEEGLTVFLQGLEKRGPDNRRKLVYISALTPDLYKTMYAEKVARFFDRLLGGNTIYNIMMKKTTSTTISASSAGARPQTLVASPSGEISCTFHRRFAPIHRNGDP
jgi:hypothetical protein